MKILEIIIIILLLAVIGLVIFSIFYKRNTKDNFEQKTKTYQCWSQSKDGKVVQCKAPNDWSCSGNCPDTCRKCGEYYWCVKNGYLPDNGCERGLKPGSNCTLCYNKWTGSGGEWWCGPCGSKTPNGCFSPTILCPESDGSKPPSGCN